MRKALGTLVLGLAGGWMLSQMRAMPGGGLFEWAVPSTCLSVGMRATALFLVGLALWNRREGLRWTLLAAITVGYAATGLLAGPHRGFPFVGLVVAVIAARIASGWTRPKEEPPRSQDGAQPANVGEMLGLFVAGAGVAIAIEGIARHVRAFGSGLAQDDTVFGATFLLFVAVGAAAFGWLASSTAARRLSFPALLAASAAACFASLAHLATISDSRGLLDFVKRWGVRLADHGTLGFDLLVGASSFVLPAMLAGAGLAGARGRRSMASAVVGAACGLVAVPRFLDHGAGADSTQAGFSAGQLVPIATMMAVAGASLAVLSESRRRPIARYAALALAILCVAPVLVRKTQPVPVLTPWSSRLSFYATTFDAPAGLFAVRTGLSGSYVTTLDGRLVTPDGNGVIADDQELRDAFQLLGAERNRAGKINVLFVGQLDSRRARLMESLGATRIDRSAAWWGSMKRLETALFKSEDGMQTLPLPAGEILSPSRARAALEHGDYDLVIAAGVQGDAPAVGDVEAPAKTVVVRWLQLDEPLRGVAAHEPTFISADGLDAPALGLVTNPVARTEAVSERPSLITAAHWDTYVPTPLSWLLVNEQNRDDKARANAFRSIAASWKPSPTPFIEGLALHYAAQQPSSPYEHDAQRVEISDAALAKLVAAAHGELDAFSRRMWEWLTKVLREKRDVARIEKYVAPVAAVHAPWTDLEVALAYADLEGLDAPAAIARLEPVVARDPSAWRAWFALGEAREIAGNPSGAAAAFKHADDLHPDADFIRRRFAMAACRAGDPAGRRIAQEIVLANPKDVQMQAYVAPGPPPPAPTSYEPHDEHAP